MAFQQLHLQTAGLVSVVQFCQTFWPREADFNDALEMMQWWGARVEGLRLAGRQPATSEACPVGVPVKFSNVQGMQADPPYEQLPVGWSGGGQDGDAFPAGLCSIPSPDV